MADPRIIWEDGTWAVIEAKHYPPGIGRSKSRDQLGDAVKATWEASLITAPGPKAIAAQQLVKVRLAEFLAASPWGGAVGKTVLKPGDFKDADPIAPPSPFMPKPYKGKDIPEYPHVCIGCGGRYYQGANDTVHETTDPRHNRGNGRCPGPATAPTPARVRARVRP